MTGMAKVAVAGRHRQIKEDPVAWTAAAEARLAVVSPSPDPLVVMQGQVALASELQARAMEALPGIDPDQALSVIIAVMPHVIRGVEAQARLAEQRERQEARRAAADTTAQALPTAVSEAPAESEGERLRRWAAELRSEAEHLGLWPDGSCGEVCARLERMADGDFDTK